MKMNDSPLSPASSSNSRDNFPNKTISVQSSNSVDSIDFEISDECDSHAHCLSVSSTIRHRVPSIISKNCAKTNHSTDKQHSTPQKRAVKNAAEKSTTTFLLNKFCRVCGDKALGYNFDVVTCESCKAFFRRNALKSKVFRCPFNGDCDVSIVSRRFCQKCRLKKCFEVGMKKESIMSEQDRLLKRRKRTASNPRRETSECEHIPGNESVTERNSADASGVNSSPKNLIEIPSVSSCSTVDDDHVTIPKSTLVMLLNSSKKLEDTAKAKCVCRCACGARPRGTLLFPAQKDESTTTENLIDFATINTPCSSRQSVISSLAVHQNRKRICSADIGNLVGKNCIDSSSAQSVNGSNYGVVNEISILDHNISNVDQLLLRNCSQNLSNFTNGNFGMADLAGQLFNDAVDAAIFQELDVIGTPSGGVYRLNAREQNRLAELMAANEIFEEPMESGDARSLTDFVNLMDIGIRRIIRMAKRIDAFKNLCKEDQIALLKGGCVELMVLRGVMAFDPVKDTWRGPKSYCIKSENVREVKGDVYDEYKKYFHSFEENLRTNESIMVILLAVTLFIGERSNVQRKDLIKTEQSMYVELLKNYLNSIYDQKRAASAYERLMSNLDDLHRLTERVISIFLHVNPKDVEPLLLEMFDWKR